jgi:hypothetical protein
MSHNHFGQRERNFSEHNERSRPGMPVYPGHAVFSKNRNKLETWRLISKSGYDCLIIIGII